MKAGGGDGELALEDARLGTDANIPRHWHETRKKKMGDVRTSGRTDGCYTRRSQGR